MYMDTGFDRCYPPAYTPIISSRSSARRAVRALELPLTRVARDGQCIHYTSHSSFIAVHGVAEPPLAASLTLSNACSLSTRLTHVPHHSCAMVRHSADRPPSGALYRLHVHSSSTSRHACAHTVVCDCECAENHCDLTVTCSVNSLPISVHSRMLADTDVLVTVRPVCITENSVCIAVCVNGGHCETDGEVIVHVNVDGLNLVSATGGVMEHWNIIAVKHHGKHPRQRNQQDPKW